jgi:hypothetical protein
MLSWSMDLPALIERCHTGLSPIIVWLLLPAVVLNEELILNKSHHVGGRGFVHHLVYGNVSFHKQGRR